MTEAQDGRHLSRTCHRCEAELVGSQQAAEAGFFCAQCGAPQIVISEHLRMETPAGAGTPEAGPSVSAGAAGEVDWQTALRYGGIVAGIGGVLTAIGLVSAVVSFVGFLWVVSAGVMVLSLYQRQRPGARMNARVGLRIGFVSGLLLTVAIAVGLATVGVVGRFAVHRMGEFDAQVANFEAQITLRMKDQERGQNEEAQAEAARLLNSPEVHGGLALLDLGFLGGLLVLFSAGGGAFAGMLGTRRQGRGPVS